MPPAAEAERGRVTSLLPLLVLPLYPVAAARCGSDDRSRMGDAPLDDEERVRSASEREVRVGCLPVYSNCWKNGASFK